ncbi:MAG TPA: accessory factor UbiK family protein [Woeseiaceae bacterium]|nr:accessory factor UbiK family protein [Woeseiaceae bacterium]
MSGARFAAFRDDSGLVFSPVLRYQTLMNDNSIEGLAKKLADSLPGGLRTMREDLEQNFRSILQGGLSRLDLVTREEFEVQEAVLARTREKLEALEKQVAEMEASSE